MSERAEQKANGAFPDIPLPHLGEDIVAKSGHLRGAYIQGYEQAEKDFALTWEDVAILITIYEQEVEAGNISRYEDEGAPSLQDASEIILRKFNEIRKK